MASKKDPLRGMNPDQNGPVEKIQNGDPKANPQSDQRSGAREAGGPGPSKQPHFAETNQIEPALSSTKDTEPMRVASFFRKSIEGLQGETLPAGSHDRAGSSPLVGENVREATGGPQGGMEGHFGNQTVAQNAVGAGDDDDEAAQNARETGDPEKSPEDVNQDKPKAEYDEESGKLKATGKTKGEAKGEGKPESKPHKAA
jgi:hypothetical protein